MNRFILILSLLAVVSVGCGQPETNACGDSPYLTSDDCRPLSWGAELPIPLYYGTSLTDEAKAATDKAIDIWEFETGINLFHVYGRNQNDPIGIESNQVINLIGMRSGASWHAAPIEGQSDEPAKTVYYYKDFIYNSKFFFNTAYSLSYIENVPTDPNTYDMLSISLHELGHIMGLDHDNNLDQNLSVMNSKIQKGSERRTLSNRDIDRIRSLYAF